MKYLNENNAKLFYNTIARKIRNKLNIFHPTNVSCDVAYNEHEPTMVTDSLRQPSDPIMQKTKKILYYVTSFSEPVLPSAGNTYSLAGAYVGNNFGATIVEDICGGGDIIICVLNQQINYMYSIEVQGAIMAGTPTATFMTKKYDYCQNRSYRIKFGGSIDPTMASTTQSLDSWSPTVYINQKAVWGTSLVSPVANAYSVPPQVIIDSYWTDDTSLKDIRVDGVSKGSSTYLACKSFADGSYQSGGLSWTNSSGVEIGRVISGSANVPPSVMPEPYWSYRVWSDGYKELWCKFDFRCSKCGSYDHRYPKYAGIMLPTDFRTTGKYRFTYAPRVVLSYPEGTANSQLTTKTMTVCGYQNEPFVGDYIAGTDFYSEFTTRNSPEYGPYQYYMSYYVSGY